MLDYLWVSDEEKLLTLVWPRKLNTASVFSFVSVSIAVQGHSFKNVFKL